MLTKKHTNSLNFNEKRTVSEKGRHFREFCENDARFPWVEFVDFPKNSLKFHQEFITFSVKTHKFNKCSRKNACFEKKDVIFVNSAKMAHVSHG